MRAPLVCSLHVNANRIAPIYTRAELERLIAPRSIAIVGASPRAGSFGMRTLENLAHFRGAVWPVNAKYERSASTPAIRRSPRCRASPICVALVVPREGVEAALRKRRRRGAGSVIVYASGYGEMAREEGAAAQRRLAEIARAARMPMLGPNCMGLVNHALGVGRQLHPRILEDAARARADRLREPVGALGYCLAQAAERGLGFRYFFSVGNSGGRRRRRPHRRDGRGSGRARRSPACSRACRTRGALLEAGARARRAGKPVIVYKLGVSEDGAAAARSHTGSLAGSAAAFRALFERAGFVPVEDYEALVEYAKFFAAAGKPLARGVAVVSGSGGAGIIAADMAARHGVPMPQPGEATTAVLRSVVPEFGAARNPCDPTGQVLNVPESFGKCCRALLDDPQYGVLVCAMSVASRETGPKRSADIAALAREQPKPIAVVWVSEWLQGPGSGDYEADDKVGLFRSMDRCFAAIAAWQRWHAESRPGTSPFGAGMSFSFPGEKNVLGEREAKAVLGIRHPVRSRAPGEERGRGRESGAELGYPGRAQGRRRHRAQDRGGRGQAGPARREARCARPAPR